MARERGFSLLEMMIAMALMMMVIGSVFSVMNPAQGSFSTEPEVADMQQRLRVAQDSLYKDLVMASAGAYLGSQTGSLVYFFAPVLPFRQGARLDAPVGSFARNGGPADTTDTITVIYVPSTTAQTTLAQNVVGGGLLRVNGESDCPRNPDGTVQNLCGFKAGMTVLIFDNTGNYDTFTITSLNDVTANITVNRPADAVATTYTGGPPNTPGIAKVVQAIFRTYYLLRDDVNKVYQLVYYDGSNGPDVPVVDNVVDLSFEYWGDPNPPARTTKSPAPIDPVGPWMTYGPTPLPVQPGFPANENCVITTNGAGGQIPRLPVLPSGANTNALVRLTEAQLTDGLPGWCPNNVNTNRYDPDLLRIRKIFVTVRVQAALESMRGPASVLFKRGGTSHTGTKWIPDQEVRFQVSPRNLNLGR